MQSKQISFFVAFLATFFVLTAATPLESLESRHPPVGYIESGEWQRAHSL